MTDVLPSDPALPPVTDGVRAFLARAPFIDVHSHAGATGWYDTLDVGMLATMRPCGVAAAFVSAVADGPVIKRGDGGTGSLFCFREPEPGECWTDTLRQIAVLEAGTETGALRIARTAAEAAAGDGAPAVVLCVEGGDFCEGDLDRLETLFAHGVRSIQPVHYRVNDLGDIQTEPEVHHGFTARGFAFVERMYDLGMVVDLCHATEQMIFQAAGSARAPLLCSHTNLNGAVTHPRFISADAARAIAGTGGVVGLWPASFDKRGYPGLIDSVLLMADVIGIDHVAIGSDMAAGRASEQMPDFRHHPAFAAALLDRGLSEDDTAKVIGGNMLRLLDASAAAAA